MHSRNPFKSPPDFYELSEVYPPLRPHVFQSSTGWTIDFHDSHAQRRLTEALLHKHFKLSLSLPDNRLCPPVPNRLNYILWLEDIIQASLVNRSLKDVRGIDIGTGASVIYPLLGCRTNATWTFTGTDIDDISLKSAHHNITMNGLDDRIMLVKSDPQGSILPLNAEDNEIYDFTMCNPPFYSDREEVQRSAEAKQIKPNSVCTGADVEMITPGGESAFVCRMIQESIEFGTKCRWYTSMLGKMSSLSDVIQLLREHKIDNYAITEFIQGQTRRWAIAWSFGDIHLPDTIARIANPHLQNLMPTRKSLSHSCRRMVTHDELKNTLVNVLLNIEGVLINEGCLTADSEATSCILVNTSTNTWSRAARRKRLGETTAHPDSTGEQNATVERSLVCRLELFVRDVERGQEEGMVLFHWTKGRDRQMFESFVSHVGRKIDSSLVLIENEPMNVE